VFAWIAIAYVIGHVFGQISAFLLEKLLVKHLLGYPTKALFSPPTSGAKKFFFPGYFEPIPALIRDFVRENAKTATAKEAIATDNGALFVYCNARVKKQEETAALLAIFQSLYGFARNVCVASLVAGAILVAGGIANHHNWETKAWLAGGAVVVAVFLFYRYLKFFRVYALETYSAYAAEFPKTP
jgi:hypothetical protein